MVTTLNAPGVSISVDDQSISTEATGSMCPLIVLATRKNKPTADGSGIAAGTAEANVLRQLTSAREVYQTLGYSTFVTSGGAPVHGDETNEYGLHALTSFLKLYNRAYYIRADIDLGELVPTSTEPVGTAPNGTYWINSSEVVGGFFRRNTSNSAWTAVPFSVVTTSPTTSTGSAGDFVFDYSTTDGTLKYKSDSTTWSAYSGFNVGTKATGTVTFSGQPAIDDTVTFNSVVYTFKASASTSTEVTIGTLLTDTLDNLLTALQASSNALITVATYAVSGQSIVVTYGTVGTAGNAYTLAVSGTNLAVSGATLATGAAGSAIAGEVPTTATIWISNTAPTGAGANDYWWKTSSSSGGLNLGLVQYRTSDSTWQPVTVVRSLAQPSLTQGTVWEDLSSFHTSGKRPIKISDGSSYSTITIVVDSIVPTTAPDDGTLWFDDDYSTFAMYVANSGVWETVATTTASNPTNRQKVIGPNEPLTPSIGAIWIDTSGSNYDSFPVVKRWNGVDFEDITASVSITDVYTAANLVLDGTFWINTGDPITKNTIKVYDSTYEPVVIDSSTHLPKVFDEATDGRWKPFVGGVFGRKAQRTAVVRALQSAITTNTNARSTAVEFDVVAVPGYPELYDEQLELLTDIGEVAFAIADTPSRMIPDGVPTGIEIDATTWKTNANGAATTGEDGWTSSGTPYAGMYSPWGLATNYDGLDVMVPPSTIALRTFAYNDSIAYPWFAPMGDKRGIVTNATSVGHLTNDGQYEVLNLTEGQQGILYDLNINPIVYFMNTGLRVWGQKNTYGVSSDLDRINVARLIIEIKKGLKKNLRGYIGEPDDVMTWTSAKNTTEKFLAGLKGLRGLADYAVRCDENTNTPERLGRNEMWVEVAVKCVSSVEFVYVPIRIVAQTDSVNG